MYWEQVVRSDDHWVMLRWCLSLRNRCSHSEIATTKRRGMTAEGTVFLMRWFNGERGLAHTSLGKTKVNTSFLLSCECATPAERFIIHQLETAQCWFHHGRIKQKKKSERERRENCHSPPKHQKLKKPFCTAIMRTRGMIFFIAAHLTTVEPQASIALKHWQIQYQTAVLRQIKRFATFQSPGGGEG